ncbi:MULTISPECIES: hypothetical protein [Enterobacteriaceae]|uniref:Metallohydrolase n=1 Tax=Enterobacter roggenkampii TaxID=1812935 RepID=A0ABD4R3L7_9ENTR|nr:MULTISPECIES: hypothetical protein [Enterobacteriaceae]MCU3447521.1 hypothetical protein [Enterobacter hormaechei subsp. steigerwaltii]POV33599.1 hypothetical protein C3388_15580 [Leclercia sp. LSNIH5]POW65860.1 hypothetical protein C3389_12575 [Leclercia sp. LSNIH2]HAZ4788755.1 hypothetical protein [Citrobacter amalonaticus]HDT6006616.1 hypothetical protein [Klebsiella michiganensis]
MSAKICFFPVGNGDMTLIQTEDDKNILIDCRIRDGEEHPDVRTQLREKLPRNNEGRLFVHLFIWTHPDSDHCDGVADHFHLGKPEDWSEKNDKIFINEIWSSPIVFRRHHAQNHPLCDDAIALNKEVKRRVNLYKEKNYLDGVGNQVLVLGKDEDGKTDDIPGILLELDQKTRWINQSYSSYFEAHLLGPSPKKDLDELEDKLGKNHSSVIINFEIKGDNKTAHFLSGGDAEVVCWEGVRDRLTNKYSMSWLDYDILQAPHHCSWHSLSHDSLSKKGDDAKTSEKAMEVFNRAKEKAFIISSSKTIENDEKDPPAYRAKEEYEKIVDDVQGQFLCVSDHKKNGENIPLEIEISDNGIKKIAASALGMAESSSAAVNRQGGGGYA